MNWLDLQILFNVIRNIFQIPLIARRNDHRLYAAAMRCEQLFLKSADPEHLSPQGDFTGHGHIRSHRNTSKDRHQCGTHSYPRARSILWRSTLRDVDVDIIFLMVIRRYTQTLGARTDHGKCSLNRLLHHVAEGTGFNPPAFAAHGRCFEGQKFAPHLSPGQAGDLPDLVFGFRLTKVKFVNTQQILKCCRVNHISCGAFFLDMPRYSFSTDLSDLTFKSSYTSFAGVVADDVTYSLRLDGDFAISQTISPHLLGNQISDCDIELFILGVSGNANNLHPIQERPRNIHRVRGTYEHYVR